MTANLCDGHWDFWSHIETPLDDLRNRYGVESLDSALAAVDDQHVQRADFERPGIDPPPPTPPVPITDHPPVAPARA